MSKTKLDITVNYLTLCVLISCINLIHVNGGKANKSKGNRDGSADSATISDNDEEILSQNYQGVVFIYPQGIRSERDIPVCTKWISKQPSGDHHETDTTEEMQGDMGVEVGVSGDFGFSNKTITNQDILVTRRDSTDDQDQGVRWESACNLIHKRYFYPPVVERLCRCPERTECPWEWSHPPSYPNAPQNVNSTTQQHRGPRDPFTIMLSSRSQAKFCTEVTSALPKCHHQKISRPNMSQSPSKIPNLVKTLRKVGGVDEAPRVTLNCFCPPLYRQWNYIGQTEPTGFGNGTTETNYYYKCDRLPRCRTNNRCGNIRTDLHFSFYHCTCPRNHLCLPKVYPPETKNDVEEDINEVLFRGQISPAFCMPFTP